jgi:transposase InsO family protein
LNSPFVQKYAGDWGELCPSVRRSMSRIIFQTLKRELETVDGKHSVKEVRQSVFMYIEAYYNRIRMHSVLDYVAPDVFKCGQTF